MLKQMFSRIFVWSILLCFVTTSYASVEESGGAGSKKIASSSHANEKLDAKRMDKIINSFLKANASNSFQSQASHSGMGVGVAVNPATLSLSFNQKIVDVFASPTSPFKFELNIAHSKTVNVSNNLIPDKDITTNIPYLQLAARKDGNDYYNLMSDGENYPFYVKSGGNGDQQTHFLYKTPQRNDFSFSFSSDTAVLKTSNGEQTIFKRDAELPYLYRCIAMISQKGDVIHFTYNPESVVISNTANQPMAEIFSSEGSQATISYRDMMGRTQMYQIVEDGNQVQITDPLKENTVLNFDDNNNISKIQLANGAYYTVNYSQINNIHYIIDDSTVPIDSKPYYVSSYTNHLLNDHSADMSYNYGNGDSKGNNFAGNNISCNKDLFDNLNQTEDWMMECGFERKTGVYSYTTESDSNIPVFNGTNTPTISHLKNLSSYNYLHLPMLESTYLDDKLMIQTQTFYDDSIATAKSMSDLSPSYDQPTKKEQKIYDLAGRSSLNLVSTFNYYDDPPSNGNGNGNGKLKSVTDPYGNTQIMTYYSNQDVNQYLLNTQTIRLYNTTDTAKTVYAQPQFINKTVSIDGKSYTATLPYTGSVTQYLNGQEKSKNTFTYDNNQSSITYGTPVSSQYGVNKQPPVIQNIAHMSQEGNDQVSWTEKQALQPTNDDSAPDKIISAKTYINQYGGVYKKVDPISHDVVLYDSYDALGRVTQVTYLPGGDETHKQIYRYQYQLLSQASNQGNVGYSITTTMITPTTGDAGYSIKQYYDSANHLFKTETQTSDLKNYFTTHEYYYNEAGKLDHQVDYYYDETGEVHPEVTRYFYSRNQHLEAVQSPNGSTVVTTQDPYNLRKFSYTLIPTGNVIDNNKSLCFDPLKSTPDNTVYNSCRVSAVSVEDSHTVNVAPPGTDRPIWVRNTNYNYQIITDPDFSYTDENGNTVPLYSGDIKASVSALSQNLSSGYALDLSQLNALATTIKSNCLQGQCLASSFNETHLDTYKRDYFSEDLVNHMATKKFYNTDDPSQVLGDTIYHRDNDGNLTAIKSNYYYYDSYGRQVRVSTALGDYNPNVEKTVVGVRQYSALGYLLNASTLINNIQNRVQIKYDLTSGLPIQMVDSLGNKIVTHYDSKTWTTKPTSVDHFKADGSLDFTVRYAYNDNGDLASIGKYDAAGKLVSNMAYSYDPVTMNLLKTTLTYPDGSTRTLLTNRTNNFTPKSGSYQANGSTIYTETYHSNHLGLPTQTDYSGSINFNLSQHYMTDLMVDQNLYNGQEKTGYTYNNLGQLMKVDNYVDGKVQRSYQYGYDALGRKVLRVANTETTGKTTEHYQYSDLDQLKSYDCVGGGCPHNLFNQPIKKSDYTYNTLFNSLDTVKQTLSNGTQSITYQYQNSDPTQVSAIDYGSQGKTTFSYDDNGNVTELKKIGANGQQSDKKLYYDSAQNLVEVDSDGQKIQYTYDSNGSQIGETQIDKNGQKSHLTTYYMGGLTEQKVGTDSRYYVAGGSIHNGVYEANVSDGYNVVGSLQNGAIKGDAAYTPFGAKTELQSAQDIALTLQKTTLGYRMMNTDTLTGWQFLGNGYRAYDPQLRVFLKHDSASPWSVGGMNGYNYASNDPINNFDPTGHATEKDVSNLNKDMGSYLKKLYQEGMVTKAMIVVNIFLGIVGAFMPGGVVAQIVGIIVMAIIGAFIESLIETIDVAGSGSYWSTLGKTMKNGEFWTNMAINVGMIAVTMGVGAIVGKFVRMFRGVGPALEGAENTAVAAERTTSATRSETEELAASTSADVPTATGEGSESAPACFTGDTLVETADGGEQPIKNIKLGELVATGNLAALSTQAHAKNTEKPHSMLKKSVLSSKKQISDKVVVFLYHVKKATNNIDLLKVVINKNQLNNFNLKKLGQKVTLALPQLGYDKSKNWYVLLIKPITDKKDDNLISTAIAQLMKKEHYAKVLNILSLKVKNKNEFSVI